MFLHKKQQEALDSQVKALIKEKKEKDNVLTNLELIHLQDVSLLQFKELRGKTTEGEKEKLMEDKEYQRTLQHPQAQLERAQEQRKSLDPIGIKKRLEDYEHML